MADYFDPVGTDIMGVTDAANFIPELWSDETVAAYKANLVMANLVTNFNHIGKKGDVFHIPAPGRLSATAKSEGVAVVPVDDTASSIDISINKHYYVSQLFEDIALIQGLDSMRQHYTDDYGYALATQVDTDLIGLGATLQGSTAYSTAVIGGDGSTTWSASGSGNGSSITDAALRQMMQTLDDANIPQGDRALIIPPVAKNTLLGLPRFTEQAFVGEGGSANSIRNGRIGDIYGMGVYVSTNCATLTNTSGTTSYRVGLMLHKSALCLVTQKAPAFEVSRKIEYLGDLMVAHMLYGVGELRDDAGIAFVIPA